MEKMIRILEKMINFALVNWKRAPLCERLTLLTSCEGVALSVVCIVLQIFVIRVRLLNFKMFGRQYYE